jgi:hypothetical protein
MFDDKMYKHALSLILSHIIISNQTSSCRGSFFSDVSVNLGGYILSFDDLEHGILRGNSKHPYKLAKQFANNDPRRYLSILSDVDNNKAVDHRIHFALNCGANSCPPIMQYTPEKLNEELHLAAMSFCGEDANVYINDETREIGFSKLLYWYMSDFGTCILILELFKHLFVSYQCSFIKDGITINNCTISYIGKEEQDG